MEMSRAKFWVYQHAGIIVLLLVLVTGVGLYFVGGSGGTFAIPTVGAVLSLAYFLQKQKLDEIRLFKELFVDFNKRYKDLNDELTPLKDPSAEAQLTDKEKQTLVDYFNLCAEEYLFHRRGYIHPDAWTAWSNGMQDILKSKRIRAFWKTEKDTFSYYGFERQIRAWFPDAA